MRQVRGTESIFYIKHEGIWCPVACETSSGMSEQTEMISTTTRDNEGWRTEKPTLQGYSISVSGALVNELPSFDYYGRNLLLNSKSFIVPYSSNAVSNFKHLFIGLEPKTTYTLSWSKAVAKQGVFDKFDVILYKDGANPNKPFSTEKNIQNNTDSFTFTTPDNGANYDILVYSGVYSNTGGKELELQNVKLEKGASATPYSIAPEEQKILSYFKLRQKKRNRELIEWKRETLGGRYIDSGRAYITDISDENPVDDMMAFTMTLSGFGKPDFVADDSVIVAEAFANYNNDLVANSNNQILEP